MPHRYRHPFGRRLLFAWWAISLYVENLWTALCGGPLIPLDRFSDDEDRLDPDTEGVPTVYERFVTR